MVPLNSPPPMPICSHSIQNRQPDTDSPWPGRHNSDEHHPANHWRSHRVSSQCRKRSSNWIFVFIHWSRHIPKRRHTQMTKNIQIVSCIWHIAPNPPQSLTSAPGSNPIPTLFFTSENCTKHKHTPNRKTYINGE